MSRLLPRMTEEKMPRNYRVPQMFAQRSMHVAQANIHFALALLRRAEPDGEGFP